MIAQLRLRFCPALLLWALLFTARATRTGATVTNISSAYLPTPADFSYDANGNLTSDGQRSYFYDAQDRLTNVTLSGQSKVEIVHDGLGRRRVKKEYGWQSGEWVLTNEIRFVYDGRLLIQERDSNNQLLATYTRGLDLSDTLAGAGGIGGLLTRTSGGGSAYYHSDGVGNVTSLIDDQNNVVARYAYDPVGRQIGQWGPLAETNPMRFSSKPWDALSGTYDFGFRQFRPDLHRWLNADPLGEAGGLNLYRFNYNNPLSFVDTDGLAPQLVTLTYDPSSGTISPTYVDEKFGDSMRIAKSRPPEDPTLVQAQHMFNQAAEAQYDPNVDALTTVALYSGGVALFAMGMLEIIPDANALTKPVGKVICKKLAVNVTSKPRTINKALETAQKWLGSGYEEIAPGVFRSADGARQFRMTTRDLLPTHGEIGPHVHFEKFDLKSGDKLKNIHTPFSDQ